MQGGWEQGWDEKTGVPALRYSDPHLVTCGTSATTELKIDVRNLNTSKQQLIRVKKYRKQERNK